MRRLALVTLLAASLALAGCSKDDPAPAASSSSPSESKTPPPPQFWPLTGLEAKAGQSVALDHPVLLGLDLGRYADGECIHRSELRGSGSPGTDDGVESCKPRTRRVVRRAGRTLPVLGTAHRGSFRRRLRELPR